MTRYGFSLSRLCLVAKRDIMENWKKNLYNCLTLYAILASALVFTMLRLHGVYEKIPNGFWVCMALVAFGGWAVVLSNVMEPMATKAKRIAFLMVPATNLEKYLWRLIYVTVGFVVSFTVALLATDLTYLLLNSIKVQDLPIVQAVLLLIAILTVLCNLASDILMGVLDPRIRLSLSGGDK